MKIFTCLILYDKQKKIHYDQRQKFHHGKPRKNLATVWRNQAETFILYKAFENNYAIDEKSQSRLKMMDYACIFTKNLNS